MTRKKFKPKLYQRLAITFMLANPRCAVWASMGMGKSSSVLSVLDILQVAGIEDHDVLIAAPLRVAKTTWPEEVEKWHHLTNMVVIPIVGSAAERKAIVDNVVLKPKRDGRLRIFTINYENIPWLVDYFKSKKVPWPFKTLVSDESTKLKSFRLRQGSKRAQALASVSHSVITRFIELSGTPAPNGLKDLWGQLWFIDAGFRLGRSFKAFEQRWFRKGRDGFSLEPMPHSQKEIEDKLRDVCISLRAEDYFDLQEPIRFDVEVDLPPYAREKYNEMEKEMYIELQRDSKDHGVEAFNAASRTMKCLQIANGAAYIPNADGVKDWIEIHDEKIQALEQIVEEAAGMPVLVAYHFKSDLARLQKHFPKGRIFDTNPKTQKDWNAGKIPIMFIHPASGGHGLNLQYGGNIIVFFSLNWNLEEHDQVIERIGPVRQLQAGLNRSVFVYYIVARNTVDLQVKERLIHKRRIQDILIEAMVKNFG